MPSICLPVLKTFDLESLIGVSHVFHKNFLCSKPYLGTIFRNHGAHEKRHCPQQEVHKSSKDRFDRVDGIFQEVS